MRSTTPASPGSGTTPKALGTGEPHATLTFYRDAGCHVMAGEGSVDAEKVVEVFRTPPYFDYHWVAQPDLDAEHGDGFTEALTQAFLGIDGSTPEQERILEAFGAEGFIPTEASNYEAIREVGEKIGVLR